MYAIRIEKDITPENLEELGVRDWPQWSCEVSSFDWTYDSDETCYILEGEVTVTPEGGAAVTLGRGDLVTFPKGMSCVWNVTAPVRKHYRFE